MPTKEYDIRGLLRWMNVLIVATGIISVVAALEIAKGARLHELNFKHVKYNHMLDEAFAETSFGLQSSRNELRQLLIDVRAQPLACIDEVNAAERMAMRAFGTDHALEICRRDIGHANEALAALEQLDRGEITPQAFSIILQDTIKKFRLNSTEFEPLVKETVRCILRISIFVIALKALLISLIGFRTSQIISSQYGRVSDAREHLSQTNEELKKLSQSKSNFLANMSHEIRTPLNGILGIAQILKKNESNPEKLRYLKILNSSGEALLGIINDVLDFSRIESGVVRLEETVFSPKEIATQVKDTIEGVTHNKGLALDLHVHAETEGHYLGDPLRIKQVLMNFAGNAAKFTDDGRVSLRLVKRNDGWLKFIVIDTGPGVPRDQIDSVFNRFEQADNSATRRHGGTGLGLAISKELVTLLGGDCGVRSIEGRGSAFWFAIPLEPADGKQLTEPQTTASLAIDEMESKFLQKQSVQKILLVEDNPVNCLVAEALLKSLGVDVVSCENGAEALDQLSKQYFDLVLMDIQMPVMSGDEAIERIRASKADYNDIPIIVLTANAMQGDEEKYLGLGANGYLSKPIKAEHLRDAVNSFSRSKSDEPIEGTGLTAA